MGRDQDKRTYAIIPKHSIDLVERSSDIAKRALDLIHSKDGVIARIELPPLRYVVDEGRLVDCFTMREWSFQDNTWYDIPDDDVINRSIKWFDMMVSSEEASTRFQGAIDANGHPSGSHATREGDCYPPYKVTYHDHKNEFNVYLTEMFEDRAAALMKVQQMMVASFKKHGGLMGWLGNGPSGVIYNSKNRNVYRPALYLEEAVRLFKSHHLIPPMSSPSGSA